MSKITISADVAAKLKHFSDGGDVVASTLQALLGSIRTVLLTAAVKSGNTITITGKIQDAEGNAVKAIVDLIATSIPVSGAGTMTVGTGTVKAGSATKVVWLQTDNTGTFTLVVTNAVAEDNLVSIQLDSGEIENIKINFT